MLVYGDIERSCPAAAFKAGIVDKLKLYRTAAPGLNRHALLVDAFIGAGELASALADVEFAARQADDVSSSRKAGAELLLALAREVARSWHEGFSGACMLPEAWPALLKEMGGDGLTLRTKYPEGYAFYALYPEAYVEAAQRSGLGPDTVVIGIRSIGMSLAAAVAAGLGARAAVTVRPTGHPFRRQVAIAPAMAERLLADPDADFAIVDEGPGLSGSSFGSVADWLVAYGIAERQIHFFPGHDNDLGPEASAEHRARWARRPRHVLDFTDIVIDAPDRAHRLETWIADVVGPLDAPLIDIYGGNWRRQRYAGEADWPPSDPQKECRKYIAEAAGERFLVKFAGLGAGGAHKLQRARALADVGFAPEVMGLAHGFLIERWLDADPILADRDGLLARIGDYLGFRAHKFGAAPAGASLAELFEMARINTGEACGQQERDRLAAFLGDPAGFTVNPVETDNRLHAWEWLVVGDHLVKTDALDHSAAHDLVGCQDIAWDVAGAAAEFALSPEERRWLAGRVGADPGLVAVLEPCYIAFQIGLWTFAKAGSPAEAGRIERLTKVYRQRLSTLLDAANGHKSGREPARLA